MPTIDTFAQLDNLAQFHRSSVFGSKVGKDTRTKCDLLVQVALGETISTELEFWRLNVRKVGIKNTKWIKFSDVMTADLVCTDEKLDLRRKTDRVNFSCSEEKEIITFR
jgi:hypothetical protein